MATSYPGGIDSFNNPTQSTAEDAAGYEHDLQHSDVNDAIEAIETELGTSPSGAFSTVKARLDDINAYTGNGARAHYPNVVNSARPTPIYEADLTDISGWTQIYPSGYQNVTWTSQNGSVVGDHSTGTPDGGTTRAHCLIIPIDATIQVGDSIETACTFTCEVGSHSMSMVGFTNGDVHGTSSGVFSEHYWSTLRTQGITGLNGTDGGTATTSTNYQQWSPFHIRLVMTAANTWRTDMSPDGYTWFIGPNSLSYTLTPTHMGFAVSNWNTSKKFYSTFHYLRRYSGVS